MSPKASASLVVELGIGDGMGLCGSRKKILTHAEFVDMQLKKALEDKEKRVIEKAQMEALLDTEEAKFQFLTMHD